MTDISETMKGCFKSWFGYNILFARNGERQGSKTVSELLEGLYRMADGTFLSGRLIGVFTVIRKYVESNESHVVEAMMGLQSEKRTN